MQKKSNKEVLKRLQPQELLMLYLEFGLSFGLPWGMHNNAYSGFIDKKVDYINSAESLIESAQLYLASPEEQEKIKSVEDKLKFIKNSTLYFDVKKIEWVKNDNRAQYFLLNFVRGVVEKHPPWSLVPESVESRALPGFQIMMPGKGVKAQTLQSVEPRTPQLVDLRTWETQSIYKCLNPNFKQVLKNGIYDELVLICNSLFFDFRHRSYVEYLYRDFANAKSGYYFLSDKFSYRWLDLKNEEQCNWFVEYIKKSKASIVSGLHDVYPCNEPYGSVSEHAEFYRSHLDYRFNLHINHSNGLDLPVIELFYEKMKQAWSQKQSKKRKARQGRKSVNYMLGREVRNKLSLMVQKLPFTKEQLVELAISDYYDKVMALTGDDVLQLALKDMEERHQS